MTHIIHRSLRHTPLVAARSEGVHIIDAHNKKYIDASGGAAVSCLGICSWWDEKVTPLLCPIGALWLLCLFL